MRSFLSFVFALAALGATAAHADDKKPAPPPAEAVSSEDVKKFVEFFDKLVDIVVANKDDCDKLAAGVTTHIDANRDLLDRAKAAKAAGKKLPDDVRKHLEDQTKKMVPAMMKCAKNEKVKAAFEKIKQ